MALSEAVSRRGVVVRDGRRRWSLRRLRVETLEDRRLLSAGDPQQAIELFHAQDALFAENAGQWDAADVYYGYNQGGTQIFFTDDSLEFGLSRRELKEGVDPEDLDPMDPGREEKAYDTLSTRFSLSFDGARPTVPVGADVGETVFNYHVGDASRWVDGVATFKTVVYPELYDGIDLHTFSRHGQMKYEFHVAPGADYHQIALSYAGINGLTIAADGSLHVETELGDMVDEGLYVYQVIDGREVEVAGQFVLLDDDTYTFELNGPYDPSVELVIDPELDWATYLGGSGFDWGRGITVDAAGNALITGRTDSSDWASGEYGDGTDAFVAKVSPTGGLNWATYLGGSSRDYGEGITVDAAGNALVTGSTRSSDWASGGFGGHTDAFVAKVSPTGGLSWAIYLGGSSADWGEGIVVDAAGNALITGETFSSDWASGGFGGQWDAFVAKVSPTGGLSWATYLGGSSLDHGEGITVDAAGNALVTGRTDSSDWASGGFGGQWDAFVAKVSPTGGLSWAIYLGGSSDDSGWGVALDAAGNALVTGHTDSSDWASGGYGGGDDAFAAKVSPTGGLSWATYLGGSSRDHGEGITVDAAGNALITGHTGSSDWASWGYGGGTDAFVAKVYPTGDLSWATYLGGSNDDLGEDIAVDAAGNTVVVGLTASSDWASGGFGGLLNAFVAKITEPPANWTVMVFSNGDNNLEAISLDNLDQMEQVNLANSDVNVVVQIDRSWGHSSALVPSTDTAGGNWTDTRRARVRFDGRRGTHSTWFAQADAANPEQNMGDDDTLVDFITWAMEVAPATHYALVLHDHGDGWRGLSFDKDPDDALSLSELQLALDAVPDVGVLVMDMCLMQMVEVATEVIGEADYLVASEDVTYGGLLDYDGWLAWLAQHPNSSEQDLASAILSNDDNLTMSVLDLSQVPALAALIADFASVALASTTTSDWERLKDARRQADGFHRSSYRDLAQYMNAVAADTSISSPIRNAAQAVAAQVTSTVVQAKGRGEGLSIYLPVGGGAVAAGYNSANLTFCDQAVPNGTRWPEFIRNLPDTGWWEVWDADWGETMFGAQVVDAAAGQAATAGSTIDSPSDVDFVRFTGSAGQVLRVELFGDAAAGGLVPVLTVYAPDQTTVIAQLTGDDEGTVCLDNLPLAEDGDYYLAITSAGNPDPLSPIPGTTSGRYSMTLIYDDPAALLPAIDLSATSVDFGVVEAFTWAEASIELTNTGGAVLEITEIALPDGSPFASPYPSVPLPIAIEPGESIDLVIGANPTGEGLVSATCRIVTNDPLNPQVNVELHVEGVDTTPPTVVEFYVNEGLLIDEPVARLNLRFSEDVMTTLDVDDLQLTNITTGELIDPATMDVAYEPANRVAAWAFPGLPGQALPNGVYLLTIEATGVTDPNGHVLDGDGDGDPGGDFVTNFSAGCSVLDRHVFYDNSYWDDPVNGPSFDDNTAIATDKVALLPGERATFANYTSYAKGINGIMVDVAGLPVGYTPVAGDFVFRVGNDSNPSGAGWSDAPAPVSITRHDGEGVSGTDRVKIVWGDNDIYGQWLEVTVLSTNLDLTDNDVFYFGNAVGEVGNDPSNALVTAADIVAVRDNPRGLANRAEITSPYDLNRDQLVDATDTLLARNATTGPFDGLRLITPPLPATAPPEAEGEQVMRTQQVGSAVPSRIVRSSAGSNLAATDEGFERLRPDRRPPPVLLREHAASALNWSNLAPSKRALGRQSIETLPEHEVSHLDEALADLLSVDWR